MYNPGWGWGYGNQLGMVSRPVQTAVKQPMQPRSAVKQYKGEGGRDASNAGASSSRGYSGRASAAAHGIGMDNYGRIGMGIGGIVGAMIGSPLSGMRLGKSMGLNARANQMAQGYTDVVNNAAGYGISQAEVDRGMTEGGASQANSSSMTGENKSLGSLGTGGQGGIDSAGDNGSASDDGGCCFIMLEARYGNGTMDEVVRKYRDEAMTEKNRRGYYKLAEVFVPLMRKSKLFKFAVKKLFADPLVSYGKWYYGENKHGFIFSPVKSAWMNVFDALGTDTKFIRENGEIV